MAIIIQYRDKDIPPIEDALAMVSAFDTVDGNTYSRCLKKRKRRRSLQNQFEDSMTQLKLWSQDPTPLLSPSEEVYHKAQPCLAYLYPVFSPILRTIKIDPLTKSLRVLYNGLQACNAPTQYEESRWQPKDMGTNLLHTQMMPRLQPDGGFKNRYRIPDFQIIKSGSYYRNRINFSPFRRTGFS